MSNIRRNIEKTTKLSVAQYDGIARPGEIVVEPTTGNVYVANAAGRLNSLAGGGGGGGATELGQLSDARVCYDSGGGPGLFALGCNTGLTSDVNGGSTLVGTCMGGESAGSGRNTVLGSNVAIAGIASSLNVLIGHEVGCVGGMGGGVSTGIGYQTLRDNVNGAFNIAIGYQAAARVTSGGNNIALGTSAMGSGCSYGITGNFNIAVGDNSLLRIRSGGNNVSIGAFAGSQICTGALNVMLGTEALREAVTGVFNSSIGACSLVLATGRCNTALGGGAGYNLTCGDSNTYMGIFSGASGNPMTVCSQYNIMIGAYAGWSTTSTIGCNNIIIGVNTGGSGHPTPPYTPFVNLNGVSNEIVVGNNSHTAARVKVAWLTVSDCRDKTCFAPVPHGLNFVTALKPTEYQFRKHRDTDETDGITRYGFLAQDIMSLEGNKPVVVTAGCLNDPSTGFAEKYFFSEAHLIPILVNAIKELKAEVDQLKAQVGGNG